MFVVRVHVAIGVQPQQVQGAGPAMLDQLAPDVCLENRAGRDRPVDQFGALGEDPAGAERVVADLAITHVVVTRQTDRRAMRCQLGVQLATRQMVECRCVGNRDGVAGVGWGDTHSIGDHQQ